MKNIIIGISLLFLMDCKTNKSKKTESNFFYAYKMVDLNEHNLYYFTDLIDTIVVIRNNNLKCLNSNTIYLDDSFKKIDELIQKNDTIYFTYYLYDVNKKMKILTGSFPPGNTEKKVIHSYSSYPYIQTICK